MADQGGFLTMYDLPERPDRHLIECPAKRSLWESFHKSIDSLTHAKYHREMVQSIHRWWICRISKLPKKEQYELNWPKANVGEGENRGNKDGTIRT